MHCCKLCLTIASILVVFGCAHVLSHAEHNKDASSPPPGPPPPPVEAEEEGVQHLDQSSFIEYIFGKYGEKVGAGIENKHYCGYFFWPTLYMKFEYSFGSA
jgi:hypothetical protein